jgi:hypothetical protein
MVIALEGWSSQIGFEQPVIQRAEVIGDSLRLHLGEMEGLLAMAQHWVEVVEVPRMRSPIALETSTDYDARKTSMLTRRQAP